MTNKSMLLKAAVLMLLSINCVHAEQTIITNITDATPDGRYTVHVLHADGTRTVTDTETDLMWRQCSAGQMGADCSGTASTPNWQEALELAASANMPSTAGYSNWRLPNFKELQTIVAYDRYDPSINAVIFPNTPSAYYWSSSPNGNNENYAWVISFMHGLDNFSNRNASYSVRLVRSAQ